MQWIINGELQFSSLLHYEKAFNEELIAYKKSKVIFFHFFGGRFSTCLNYFFPLLTFLWLNLHTNVKPTCKMSKIHHKWTWWRHHWWRCWWCIHYWLCCCGHCCSSCPWYCHIVLNYRATFGYSRTIVILYSGRVYVANIPQLQVENLDRIISMVKNWSDDPWSMNELYRT